MSPLYIDESVQRVNSLICVLIAARRDDSHVDPAQLLDELIQLQGFAYSVRDSIMEAKEAALAEPEQEPVGINGLTEAETDASASVAGLVGKPEREPAGVAVSAPGADGFMTAAFFLASQVPVGTKVYTAPTPRKESTNES